MAERYIRLLFFKKYARLTTSKPIKRNVSPSLVSRIITGRRFQNTTSSHRFYRCRNVIYKEDGGGFLHQTNFSIPSYRHFYSVRAFSPWLGVYIHPRGWKFRLAIFVVTCFSDDPTLCRSLLWHFDLPTTAAYCTERDANIIWNREKIHPPIDIHILFRRKTENNSTFATWKCIRCTIIIISLQRVYIYIHVQ